MVSFARLFDEERFKRAVALAIAIVTVVTAGIALLQSDASARDDRANRDTKRYATEVMGRKVSGDARVNFDYNAAYQAWYELDTLANSATVRGDDAAAQRYIALRDELTSLSPLLAAPYFDPEQGQPDVARYEVDVYLDEMTVLNEKFLAASTVKDAWDAKANGYILHLTLLAVSLFLFGLSITIANPISRWIFAGVGLVVAVFVTSMAISTFLQPVEDLRDRTGAIDSYARGIGLAHQEQWDAAISAYDQAVQVAPNYTNVYIARAQAHAQQGKLPEAAADYERARAEGSQSASVAGELAWIYYLQGRFTEANTLNRIALEKAPGELWIQFDLGLSLIAAGQGDAARVEYAKGMALAEKQVAEALAAGQEAPSDLWWSLDDAAISIEALLTSLESSDGLPPRDKIVDPAAVTSASSPLVQQLKSLAVALEYTGKPPQAATKAAVTPFEFSAAEQDEQGNLSDPVIAESFPSGTKEVLVSFDYTGMQDGQEVLFRVYIDDEEDPSWRLLQSWDLGETGTAEKPLSLAYSDAFVLVSGQYTVEMYVNNNLVQRGSFVIEEE